MWMCVCVCVCTCMHMCIYVIFHEHMFQLELDVYISTLFTKKSKMTRSHSQRLKGLRMIPWSMRGWHDTCTLELAETTQDHLQEQCRGWETTPNLFNLVLKVIMCKDERASRCSQIYVIFCSLNAKPHSPIHSLPNPEKGGDLSLRGYRRLTQGAKILENPIQTPYYFPGV